MNNLTFTNGAYRLEKENGEIFEGVVSNLVAHFKTDTITIIDRVTLVKLPIITAQSNNLQIGGQTKTFEQIKTIIETELAKGGGASSADAVSYDNTTSGLQSTNVQDAIDEIGANLGEFEKVKYIHFAPTDETLLNFVFADLNELNEIARARKNNEDFIVYGVILYQGGLQTKIAPISQGDSFDGTYFFITSCVDLHLLGLTDNPVQKLSIRINIPYQTPSQSDIWTYINKLAVTPSEYERFKQAGIIDYRCEYLIVEE